MEFGIVVLIIQDVLKPNRLWHTYDFEKVPYHNHLKIYYKFVQETNILKYQKSETTNEQPYEI